MRRRASAALAALLALQLACAAGPRHPPADPALREFLAANEARYREALRRARVWLDALEVDPFELAALTMQGKKRLVEQLDAYALLIDAAPEADRPALMARAREVARFTYEPRYHDMLDLDARLFEEDATSYLRAAYLLDQLGLDTQRYREEIRRAQPRFDAHLPFRGPNQRMAFHLYYRHFGLEEPFPLGDALESGRVRSRPPLESYGPLDVYGLTHEVFAAYTWGEDLDAEPFTPEDLAYLRTTLPHFTELSLQRDDADLTAELVTCLAYLGFTDLPLYRQALAYLLDAQHESGKWGNWEAYRPQFRDYLDVGLYLHTTLVAMLALDTAFRLVRGRASRQAPATS